jgi:hypothetical protein
VDIGDLPIDRAVVDLRRLLGLLREGDLPPTLQPRPGLMSTVDLMVWSSQSPTPALVGGRARAVMA